MPKQQFAGVALPVTTVITSRLREYVLGDDYLQHTERLLAAQSSVVVLEIREFSGHDCDEVHAGARIRYSARETWLLLSDLEKHHYIQPT